MAGGLPRCPSAPMQPHRCFCPPSPAVDYNCSGTVLPGACALPSGLGAVLVCSREPQCQAVVVYPRGQSGGACMLARRAGDACKAEPPPSLPHTAPTHPLPATRCAGLDGCSSELGVLKRSRATPASARMAPAALLLELAEPVKLVRRGACVLSRPILSFLSVEHCFAARRRASTCC